MPSLNILLSYRLSQQASSISIRACVLMLALSSACAGAFSADLEVWLDGVRNSEGNVRVALFENANGFPNSSPLSAKVAAAERDPTGRVRVTFSGLVPGRYAIAAFHDSDNDGELNTNVMGLPTEAYGFSNNAHGHFGPPKFDDAAFDLRAADLSITVHEPRPRTGAFLNSASAPQVTDTCCRR